MGRFVALLLVALVAIVASVSAESVISLVPGVTEVDACICDAQPVPFTAQVTESAHYSFVKSGDDYGAISMPIAPPVWDFPESVKDFSSFVTPSCFISVGNYNLKVTANGPSTDYFDLLVHVTPCLSLEDLNPSKGLCFGQTKTYQIKLKNKSRTADKNYTIFLSGSAAPAVNAPVQVFVPSEGETITEFSLDSSVLDVGEHDLVIRAVAIYAVTGQPTEDEAELEMNFQINDCQNLVIDAPDELDKCFEDSLSVPVKFTNNGPVKEELSLSTDSVKASFSQSSIELLPGVTKEVTLTLSKEFAAESVALFADNSLGSRSKKIIGVNSKDCYSILVDGPINESACSDWRSTFKVTVTNEGEADKFTAKVKMPFSQLSETGFALKASETKELELSVSPGLDDGEYQPVITVSSSKSTAEFTGTINFKRCYRVRLAAEPYFVCQCQDKAFPVDILNVGSHPDEYEVGLTSGPDWLLFDNASVKVSGYSRVTVNPHVFTCAPEPGEYNAILNVISTTQNNSERSSKVCINFTMLSKADCYTALIEANDGEFVECKSSLIAFNVTNAGPVDNAFSLKVEGPKWVTVNPEVLSLKPHEVGQSYLVISPPLNTVGNEYEVMIRVISKGVATEKKIIVSVGAVGSKEESLEWYAQIMHANGLLNVSGPGGAIALVLSPDGNVSQYVLEPGFVLLQAEPGEWLVSVEYAGETQTLSYTVEGAKPQTGMFTASDGLLYAGVIILFAVLAVVAYSKTRK